MTVTQINSHNDTRMANSFGMFNFWRERLGLLHWDLNLTWNILPKHKEEIKGYEADKEKDPIHYTWAWLETPFDSETGTIYINPDVLRHQQEDRAIEVLVVHELCHCKMSGLDDFVDNAFEHFIKKHIGDFLFDLEYTRHMEIVVEHFAQNFVSMREQLSPEINWAQYV